jgi:hypothetical protein
MGPPGLPDGSGHVTGISAPGKAAGDRAAADQEAFPPSLRAPAVQSGEVTARGEMAGLRVRRQREGQPARRPRAGPTGRGGTERIGSRHGQSRGVGDSRRAGNGRSMPRGRRKRPNRAGGDAEGSSQVRADGRERGVDPVTRYRGDVGRPSAYKPGSCGAFNGTA